MQVSDHDKPSESDSPPVLTNTTFQPDEADDDEAILEASASASDTSEEVQVIEDAHPAGSQQQATESSVPDEHHAQNGVVEEASSEFTADREVIAQLAELGTEAWKIGDLPQRASNNIVSTSQSYEDESGESWRQYPKHFLILNSSGKPIFSYHGDENALAGLMALSTAIISVVQDHGDSIRHIQSGRMLIVFRLKGPLYLIATSSIGEPVVALHKQLDLLYNQIILVVTKGLEKVILRNPAYDVRDMLDGVGHTLTALADRVSNHPGYLMAAVQPLPMPAADRQLASAALAQALKSSGALYGLLFASHHLVACERERNQPPLHTDDVLLLANFIACNESYRRGQSENFCPVCLSNYNASVFLHAYVHYLDLHTGVYVVLLASDSDTFHALRAARMTLQAALGHGGGGGVMDRVCLCASGQSGVPLNIDQLPQPLGRPFPLSPLWHYVARHIPRRQVVIPDPSPPFTSPDGPTHLANTYAHLYGLMHEVRDPRRANKVAWASNDDYATLAIIDRDLELYLIMDPLTTKAEAVSVVDILRRHLLDVFSTGDVLVHTSFA